MAEHVQASLDQMVAPLQDLQERGVFTGDEIHAIVTRRRDSEYALRRRQPRKADFLMYLKAEMDLEKLRQLRSKRLLKQQRKLEHEAMSKQQREDPTATDIAIPSNTNTKHIGDKHVIQHIHLLWVRTMRKYRADVALYLQYADFCKETGAFRKLSRCYAEALQLHPKVAGLWIEAASHEFFQAGSVPSARILLQRGLRINKTAVDLWLQYFGLELHFVQKMQGRRNILMGSNSSSTNNNKDSKNDDKEEEEVPSLINKEDEEEEEQLVKRTHASFSVDAHRMATLVYDNAILAVPDNVAFRLQFLDQCRLFPDTAALAAHIVASIQRDCQGQPEAWIARAMYAWEKMGSGSGQQQQGDATEAKGFVRTTNAVEDSDDDDEEQEDNDNDGDNQEPSSKRQRSAPEDANNASSSNDPVLAVLQEATRTVPTKDMYLQVIRFLRSYLEQLETGNGGGDNDSKEEQENEEQEDNSERLEVVRSFLEGILKDTTTLEFYDSDLLSAHVDYLESGEKVEDAIHLLEAFLQSNPATADKSQLPAKLWTDWARLVSFSQSVVAGISILEKALKQIPMAESDHMIVLLELLGAKLLANIDEKVTGDCGDIFQRIILLAPGFVEMEDIEEPSFGIDNVSSACLQYLRHKMNTDGVAGARVVYNAVLFQSGVGKSMGANGDESIKAFIDEAIEAEMNDKSNAAAKNRLRRLYDLAVETFSHTSFADEYRRRRNEVVIYGMNLMIDSPNGAAGERLSGDGLPRGGTKAFSIPTFDVSSPGFRPEAFAEAFRTFQIVHLRNTTKGLAKRKHTTWKDIGGIFEGLDPSDRESWCIETQKGEAISAATFLEPRVAATRAYCSFLIQKDKNAYQAAVEKLPLKELGWTEWHYEPALWLFFGRNSLGNGDLEGRAEHTDSVSHDGTWHYQLSGTKEWYLRPSPKLMVHLQSHLSPDLQLPLQETTRIRLECMEGDVIVINTRLWFHSTVIPPQQFPSVSYARDFRETTETRTTEEGSDGMKNVDGLYATKDIEVGSIIFTEKDAPDCELHRSSVNPNCEVVELEDGTSAVVSSRSIAEGEFFCVAESSEEEDGSEDGSNDDSSASDS